MRGQIEDTVSALRRVDERFARAMQFAAQRGEVAAVLAQLSEAVPESTAVIAFHADSAQGSFSALAPSIAQLVASLDSAPLIIGPRIAGSITREVAAGSRFERASFRFARAPARFPRSSRR
jgi:hypothetical protein